MNLREFPDDMIERLSIVMRPEHFLGFLNGCIQLELARPEPDTEQLIHHLRDRESWIQDQRDADKPDGLPIEPLWWTDHDPDLQADEDEVLACAPILEPFLLCSSVEPHARWAVIVCSEDKTPFFCKNRAEARVLVEETQKEGRRQRQEAIDEAWNLVSQGDISGAMQFCDGLEIDFAHDEATGLTTIDGQTFPEADGPEEAAQADDGA